MEFGVPTPEPAVVRSLGQPIIDERIESLCRSAREAAEREEETKAELFRLIAGNGESLTALIIEQSKLLQIQNLRNQVELVEKMDTQKLEIEKFRKDAFEDANLIRLEIGNARSEVWNDFWRGCWRFFTKPL